MRRRSLFVTVAGGALLLAGIAKAADYELPLTSTGFAGLVLLKSDFDDAAATFGPAKVSVSKRGLQPVSSACYVSARKGDGTKLTLKSEEAGRGSLINHYTLVSVRRVRAGACSASAALHADLPALDGHLRLGMSKDEVRAAIGSPAVRNLDEWNKDDLPGTSSHANSWVYMATWHAPFGDVDREALAALSGSHDGAHEYAWTRVMLNFRDSRLTRIDVSHGVGY